jgi:hypothetical protein
MVLFEDKELKKLRIELANLKIENQRAINKLFSKNLELLELWINEAKDTAEKRKAKK